MSNKTVICQYAMLLLAIFPYKAGWADNEHCEVTRWEKGFVKPYMAIRKPGRYCIDQDYDFVCYPWTHSCRGEFIDIEANDVELDLQGHTLSTTNTSGYTGIRALGKNIRIHNGKISSVGRGVVLHSPDARSYTEDFFKREPLKRNKIPTTGNFLLENLDISTDTQLGWWAIQSSGADIVLRNNKIIGAVLIHGLNAILEGNRISLNARDYNPNQRFNFRYGVLARNADNLKIIGNSFGILGDRTETTAIAIWDTQSAVVKDNRISGATTPIQVDNSTVEQSNNKTGLW